MRNHETNIVVMAAGKGTRMKSAKPKVLHKVCGLTLLERVLRACRLEHVSRVIVVVGYQKESVEAEAAKVSESLGLNVVCAHQENQNGTGGAAQAAVQLLTPSCKDVIIVPGDSPLVKSRSLEELRGSDADLVLLTQSLETPTGFGRVVRNSQDEVERIVEEKDCSEQEKFINEVNTSFYLSKKETLLEALSKLTDSNAQKELYLTDIVQHARESGASVKAVLSSFGEDLTGANSVYELQKLEALCQQGIIRTHMDNGVSFECPATSFVEEDVAIGADTTVGPGTKLIGKSRIGSNVTIEGSVYLKDSEVSDNSEVRFGCYLNQAKVGESSVLGPYAHLRPGSVLESEVKVGNFVETKKAVLKKGAKVNHLSYIGDAEIGEDANVGAGTITCNYDGFVKSKTTIGSRAFIGSNTALVAPVEVGAGAYVGAGSVITKNVSSDALGITRAEQRNIPGYAAKKRGER